MKRGKIAKHIKLTDKSILAVLADSGLTIDDLNQLQKDIRALKLDVVVVQVNKLEDLVVMPAAEMAKRGWYRIETLQKLALKGEPIDDRRSSENH